MEQLKLVQLLLAYCDAHCTRCEGEQCIIDQVIDYLLDQMPYLFDLEDLDYIVNETHASQEGIPWIELQDRGIYPAFADKMVNDNVRILSPNLHAPNIDSIVTWWPISNYNITWRLWRSKPSPEQQTHTPWLNEND